MTDAPSKPKLTVPDLAAKKAAGERLSMVAVADFMTATWVHRAGIDIVGVGDSMGMTMYGHENTLELSVDQEVKVKITEVDGDRRRISLSIKQALPEWESRSQWQDERGGGGGGGGRKKPRRQEFTREDEKDEDEIPAFNADASLEAILEELKQRGIGRK